MNINLPQKKPKNRVTIKNRDQGTGVASTRISTTWACIVMQWNVIKCTTNSKQSKQITDINILDVLQKWANDEVKAAGLRTGSSQGPEAVRVGKRQLF